MRQEKPDNNPWNLLYRFALVFVRRGSHNLTSAANKQQNPNSQSSTVDKIAPRPKSPDKSLERILILFNLKARVPRTSNVPFRQQSGPTY